MERVFVRIGFDISRGGHAPKPVVGIILTIRENFGKVSSVDFITGACQMAASMNR
jgi:hypothetical protein